MPPYDFDQPAVRRGSGSFKWDATGRLFGRDDLLPFWVADMDFATPQPILDAIARRLEHPVLGYEERPAAYADAVTNWLARRHGWEVPAEWLVFCPPSSIVAIYGLIVRLTNVGDGIAVPTPTYGPLLDLVEDTGRRLIRNPLAEVDGRFVLDMEGLDAVLDDGARMLLLCNPHNPTGRVFSADELQGLADVAASRGLVVVSDEVHADLVRPGFRYLPFGSVRSQRSVTVLSPNKAFNTAGLPQASLVVPDEDLRREIRAFLNTTQLNHDTSFGGVAMIAAYNECEEWLDAVNAYIDGNHRRVAEFLAANVPGVSVHEADGTYLAWLDYRELRLSEVQVTRRLVEAGGVALFGGTAFGREGDGFLRMNLACSRDLLDRGLDGLAKALG